MFQRCYSQFISARITFLAWLILIAADLCCGDRLGCEDGQDIPSNRVNTTERLERLRELMSAEPHRVDAYIVPMNDAHQSEYVAPRDARVKFISGFSGSSGLVVVTWNSAALWTDGRYFLQADNQIDCNWSLMMNGSDPKPPSETEWLISELAEGSSVGADPRLMSATRWKFMERALTDGGLTMKVVHENLVDMVWTEGRPPPSSDPIYVHDIKYSGVNWQSKVDQVRSLLTERRVAALVITSLDEVAWLFNLRGNDVPHTPVFYSYAVVDYNSAHLWVNISKLSPAVRDYLQSADCIDNSPCVQVHAYDEVLYDIHDLVSSKWTGKVIVPGRSSYTDGASYSIYNRVFSSDRLHEESPLVALKGRKNAVEVVNMRNASRRDSLVICDFLSFLEEQIVDGEVWDELSAARKLEEFRSVQPLHMGPSFETISAFSSNAAIIHYTPSNRTSRRIDASSTYLLDSGGQYLDGTTDVTRTMHFGEPSEFHRETYTRVLMGAIDLARLTIAHGTKDNQLGVVARRHLFDVGLNYRHGTGHGIGCFLAVHEGPTLISGGVGHLIELGQFFSDEPGYYEPEQFGVRLETILHVKKADVKYGVDGRYLQFEPITLVPFEPKLIIPELMTEKQLVWLNGYHMRVWDELKTTLVAGNRTRALRWLKTRIQPITRTRHTRRNPPSVWQTSAHEAAIDSTRSSSYRHQAASVLLLTLLAYLTQ